MHLGSGDITKSVTVCCAQGSLGECSYIRGPERQREPGDSGGVRRKNLYCSLCSKKQERETSLGV